MRLPQHFREWLRSYGLMNNTGHTYYCIEQIAYRAYRKGRKDERDLWKQGREKPSRWKT